MLVRLAFAMMVQADADIMLIDEVLAVGDAAFAQQCMDVFREKRRAGKTIVLVTHDMATVQTLCHRAMLLHDGELRFIGDPEETALRYYRLNFAAPGGRATRAAAGAVDVNARVADAWLRGEAGEPVETSRRASRSGSTWCWRRAGSCPSRTSWCACGTRRGLAVFEVHTPDRRGGPPPAAGSVRGLGREPLLPGRLHARRVHPRGPRRASETVQGLRLLHFVGRGGGRGGGRRLRPRRRPGGARSEPTRSMLRDVPGPSALGGGWRRALELLYLIAALDFKRHYFGTALGYVWSIARPLMLFGVLLAVFTQIFRLGSEVPHYPVLLLFNIVLFGFFQEATGIAVKSIVAQEGVVRKTQFPRLVIPLAVVLTTLFNLGLNLVVVLVFLLAFGVTPMWTWLLVPAAARGADRAHDGGVDARLVAVPAVP